MEEISEMVTKIRPRTPPSTLFSIHSVLIVQIFEPIEPKSR